MTADRPPPLLEGGPADGAPAPTTEGATFAFIAINDRGLPARVGDRIAGRATYHREGGRWVFLRTETGAPR